MLIDRKCAYCGAIQHVPEFSIAWNCNECDGTNDGADDLADTLEVPMPVEYLALNDPQNWPDEEITEEVRPISDDRYDLGNINDVRKIVTGEDFSNDGMDEDGTCPLCCGDGKYDVDSDLPCPNCNGTGSVW